MRIPKNKNKNPRVNRAQLEKEHWKTGTNSAGHDNIWKNEGIVANHMRELKKKKHEYLCGTFGTIDN